MNKNIVLLWQGQLVSQLGTQAFSIAMMFWLMQHTGSAQLISLILTLSILPSIVLGPIAGVVADKLSRKYIIIVTDFIRALSVFILAISIYYQVLDRDALVILFAFTAVLNGICKALFQPAIDAWLPDLVPETKLAKTIALFSSTTQSTAIIGQALAGILFKILGAPLLLLLDACSYLISAVSECFISSPQKRKDGNKVRFSVHIKSYYSDLMAGIDYVKAQKGMTQTMLFAASLNFFIAPLMLLLPFFVADQLVSEAHWYGFLLAGMAVGSLAGFWFSARSNISGNRRAIVMFSSMLFLVLAFLLLSQSFSSYLALMYLIVIGFCLGVFNLQNMAHFQAVTPSYIRGRVMGLLMTISSALLPLGLLSAGQLASLTNNNSQIIFALSAISIAVVTSYFVFNTKVRCFLFVEEQQ